MLLVIEPCEDGKTLRDVLRRRGVSAALLARLKKNERGILLAGARVTVRAVVHAGDVVELAVEDASSPAHILPRELPLEILLETPDLIVVNKPPAMPTHPSHGHFEDTLANALAFYFAARGETFVPRFINRLDRDTTGVVLVARHALAAAALSRAMAGGEIHKEYLALAHGELREPLVIESGIRRARESIILRETCPVGEGDRALSEVFPLAWGEGYSLLRLVPATGRTHQLRVHLSSVGHPLLGDGLYGVRDGFPRHALHAARLTFPDPIGGAARSVRAPLPADMREKIESIRWEVSAFENKTEKTAGY